MSNCNEFESPRIQHMRETMRDLCVRILLKIPWGIKFNTLYNMTKAWMRSLSTVCQVKSFDVRYGSNECISNLISLTYNFPLLSSQTWSCCTSTLQCCPFAWVMIQLTAPVITLRRPSIITSLTTDSQVWGISFTIIFTVEEGVIDVSIVDRFSGAVESGDNIVSVISCGSCQDGTGKIRMRKQMLNKWVLKREGRLKI